MSREEARISTTHATIEDNASPGAARNFATSGDRSEGTRSAAQGRMQEQAVFGYFFPRKKVTRRKGGRGQWRPHINWISQQFQSQQASKPIKQIISLNNP
ncbi:hypothetical protein [Pseudomonas sp. BP8]|uniref:hypothetical protein n=1 Tax=Pseudomonas sp. BP8 TaxID=2817864 RepID=UPI001AE2F0F4|nr:hypothetical protein [Pseudomonas sp. BP8]MBP2263608.1 hypothetical protein [Pseudomonas sp. BP8]